MTAARRKDVPKADVIQLWTRAYAICSFPECGRELIWGDGDPRLRGAMAHIVASSESGPRGGESIPSEARNRYGNLILLCPNHHEEIDADIERFTSDGLRQMKSHHEERIARQLAVGKTWQEELSTLEYINVPRVILDPASRGILSDDEVERLLGLTTLRDQGFGLAQITLALEEVLKSWAAQAIDLSALDELGEDAAGARVSFEENFRTKNMTGSEKQRAGFELSGDLANDPHIYLRRGDRTIYFPLDPRWVTTSTAFVTFTSGIARLAGVGVLKAVNADQAVVSPLALGAPPLSPAAKAFEEAFARDF